MKQTILHDQRGVAMLFEVLLVAAVFVLVGVAIYQTNHRPNAAAVGPGNTAAPSSTVGLAASAAATSEQSSATDAALSADATSSASDQLTQVDNDATNLGGTSNASF